MEVAHLVFGIFGNVTALFLFLSPIVTFWRIIRHKSTEDFSGIPYNMTLLNCFLSAWYGLPFVSPNNLLVSTINGTGAVIELVYVMIFIVYASRKERMKTLAFFTIVATVSAMVALFSLLIFHHGHGRQLFCGFAAAIFSVIMYGSPLSIMRLVIRTKSVEFMPFFLSLFSFLCGTSWFIFGLLGRDPFVTVPNGCGSALGAVQLILYAIYRNHKGAAAAAAAAAKEAEVEMNGNEKTSKEAQKSLNDQV
ncbi:Bidirectional sugar transporter SWEET1a [Cocos nucifera]|uniref:Bidirectional sugar transporter SWEET n=1 Tax=Cocos nucifera TaxID=13894 RepID=A0A8K0HXJ2_COCNU|nr:Bidirectional sugar transporter SWEET1a [Cocos nucifera]